jgi:3-oxoacyl-[acyl-carrier protein] reductase
LQTLREPHQTRVFVISETNQARPLDGKVAVVTGGGRGIGAAIAEKLAGMGASTVICGRSRKPLDETAARIKSNGERCEALQCDVSDWKSIQEFSEKVRSQFGRTDVLVNNAGIGSFSSPLHQLPLEEWDKVINTNLRGPYLRIRAFAPMMIEAKGGDIINISSLAGKNALPNGAVYAASKWGLNGLSYSVAEELRNHKIRVTVICPGSTQTELSPHEGKASERMLQPSDVAHVVAMVVTQAPQSFASEILLRPTQKP